MTAKTQLKTDIVERYKNGESIYKIARDEKCSHLAVFRELKRKGVDTGRRFWTNIEKKRLKEGYPISSNEELLQEFPNRGKRAICRMANKLGLKRKTYRRICGVCGRYLLVKIKHGRTLCLKCIKKQWECDNPENHRMRQKIWIRKNPKYVQKYRAVPKNRELINRYLKQRRKENPKIRLDLNMGIAIYQALKEKKAGRRWEGLVDYNLEELMRHLENQFDEKMNWENYGSFWHVDHIRPRSSFEYISPIDPAFKECWALENLQPLERIANLKKGNTFQL